jgi:glycosyltransferase involved in cell wall biosynthesis
VPRHDKQSTPPLVSIIVPVFNRKKLVKRVIGTVKAQTYIYWELILVDDASTDATKSVIESLTSNEPRVRSVDNVNNKGPSGARNTGLDLARGKYIAYQDSDDEWQPYHLEKMIYFLEKYPQIDLMTADPLRKYEETGEVFQYDKMNLSEISHTMLENAFLIDKEALFDEQLRGRVITTQCLVGKVEIMRSVRWDENLGAAEDNLYNLSLCAKQITVCHLSDYHTTYWIHGNNLSNVAGTHSPQSMEKIHIAFANYWEKILSDFPLNKDQKKYVKNCLVQTYAWHLGYHTFEPQKKYLKATNYYIKALRTNPRKFRLYSSLFKCVLKLIKEKFG